jgi:hypothetical protein
MTADSLPQEKLPDRRSAIFQWIAIGVAGVGFFAVAAVHIPDQYKFPGVLTVGLGLAAGWGWGRFGRSLQIEPRRTIAVIVGFTIAGAELLGTWKDHQDRAVYLRGKWEARVNDPIAVALKADLARDREGQTAQEKEQRLQQLAEMEQADALRWGRLEFHGYLASRMERTGIRALQQGSWPEVVWGVEVLLGSALGAWLALIVLQGNSPRTDDPPAARTVD